MDDLRSTSITVQIQGYTMTDNGECAAAVARGEENLTAGPCAFDATSAQAALFCTLFATLDSYAPGFPTSLIPGSRIAYWDVRFYCGVNSLATECAVSSTMPGVPVTSFGGNVVLGGICLLVTVPQSTIIGVPAVLNGQAITIDSGNQYTVYPVVGVFQNVQ